MSGRADNPLDEGLWVKMVADVKSLIEVMIIRYDSSK